MAILASVGQPARGSSALIIAMKRDSPPRILLRELVGCFVGGIHFQGSIPSLAPALQSPHRLSVFKLQSDWAGPGQAWVTALGVKQNPPRARFILANSPCPSWHCLL